MKKQKSLISVICKCPEYKQEITKIRNKLLFVLKEDHNEEECSAYKLLKMHLFAYEEKEKYIQKIDVQMREFMRINPTIQYSESMGVGEMVRNLMLRIKKEKSIHSSALKKEKQLATRYVQDHRSAGQQIDYLKELLLEEQREQQTWKNEALKQQKTNHSLKKEIELKKQQNRLLQQLVNKLQLKIKSLQIKVSSLEKDKAQLSKDFLQKSEEVSKLANDFRSFKGELSYSYKLQLMKQMDSIKSQKSIQCNPSTTRLSINRIDPDQAHLFSHLFVGDILFNQDESRHFIIESIQNSQKNLIVRTKLIFRYDHINHANLHRYIDDIPHLVFLMKTDGGQIIGAYSEGAFKPKVISNKEGLIMSLTNRKVFKNTKKAIMYDEQDIIFGNFDLKFKNGDNKLMSNLGGINSFYDCKGESVECLLGEGKGRECKMKALQVYQILFEL